MTEAHDENEARNLRHQKAMERKKALIDARIAAADGNKGLVLILTGNGKGKSSSAFGMVARALGHGMRCGVVQFIKSRTDTGEEGFFSRQPNVEWHVMGDGFTWDTQNREQDIRTAEKGWDVARQMLRNPEIDLVVLDELTYCITYGYLDADAIVEDILSRPPMQHVVITGRNASRSLTEIADTITEMEPVKHSFEAGIQAQKGVEW